MINTEMDLDIKLKMVPEKPGAYIMKDEKGSIIYIGKAVNLRNRVRQYFQALTGQTLKVHIMVSQIKDFEFIVTNSEVEALILECNLIKKHRPKFNILLKDDKTYPFIKVTLDEDFPRILLSRKIEKDGAKYFGPYTSGSDVKQTIEFLKKIFPVRNCNRKLPVNVKKNRPCLNYHIDRCKAPCHGLITKEEYNDMIKCICSFLSGKKDELITKLEKEMGEASQNMDYEMAASIRDKINALNNMFQEQKVLSTAPNNQDLVAVFRKNKCAVIQIFFVRKGKLIGRKSYLFEDIEDDEKELIGSFIKQFYNTSDYIPSEILLEHEVDDRLLIERWLGEKKGARVYIKIPKRGEKLKLIKMVSQNAKIHLENWFKTKEQEKKLSTKALKELASFIEIKETPIRIEAYDISNTGTTEITGSMVVFEKGLPLSRDYRRFKIKTLVKQDDYAAMGEMIFRRFRRGEDFLKYPDLIFVDGGIGHVTTVIDILLQFKINIPVFGMVKDEKHKTRGLVSPLKEYDLSEKPSLLILVSSIQNEAHRFALEYNRRLREKRYRKSELDEIPGIGAKRKRNLIKHFGSVRRVKDADVNELIKVEGINKSTAENIYSFFKGKR